MTELPDWSVRQVASWMEATGQGEHAAAFVASGVDGALLSALDDEMLVELGMDSELARVTFANMLQEALDENLLAVPDGKPKRTKSRKSKRRPSSIAEPSPAKTPPPMPQSTGGVDEHEYELVEGESEAMENLATMFPGVSREDIEHALRINDGQQEGAVDTLLASAMQGPQSDRRTAQAPRTDHRTAQDHQAKWIHGRGVTREVAEQLLFQQGGGDGLFLVRPSHTVVGAYVLSLCVQGEVLHHVIYAGQNQFELFGLMYPSLTDLVAYLSDYHPEEGWTTPLTNYVAHTARVRSGSFRREPRRREPQQHVSPPPALLRPASGPSRIPEHGLRDFNNPWFGSDNQASAAQQVPHPLIHQGGPLPHHAQPFAVGSPTSQALRPARKPTRPVSERREDYDLEAAPQEAFVDRQWEVALHETAEVEQIGLQSTEGLSRRDVVMLCTRLSVKLLSLPENIWLGEFQLSNIGSVDATANVLRLVTQDGMAGVWYFDCQEAPAIKQTIEQAKRDLSTAEDRRIAQLMQDEEFMARLRADPEFQRALVEEGDPGASAFPASPETVGTQVRRMKTEKRRKLFSKLAKKFSVRKRHSIDATPAASRHPDAFDPVSSGFDLTQPQPPIPVAAFEERTQNDPIYEQLRDPESDAAQDTVSATSGASGADGTASSTATPSRASTVSPPNQSDTAESSDPPVAASDVVLPEYSLLLPKQDRPAPTEHDSDDGLPPNEPAPYPPDDHYDDDEDDDDDLHNDMHSDGDTEPMPSQPVLKVRATMTRTPNPYDPTALSYKTGDLIVVLERLETGRWFGSCEGRSGHFPFTEVEPLDSSDPEYEHLPSVQSLEIDAPPSFDAWHVPVGELETGSDTGSSAAGAMSAGSSTTAMPCVACGKQDAECLCRLLQTHDGDSQADAPATTESPDPGTSVTATGTALHADNAWSEEPALL